jgi:hypothetical protein
MFASMPSPRTAVSEHTLRGLADAPATPHERAFETPLIHMSYAGASVSLGGARLEFQLGPTAPPAPPLPGVPETEVGLVRIQMFCSTWPLVFLYGQPFKNQKNFCKSSKSPQRSESTMGYAGYAPGHKVRAHSATVCLLCVLFTCVCGGGGGGGCGLRSHGR